MRFAPIILFGIMLFLPINAKGKDPDAITSLYFSPKEVKAKVGEEISIQVMVKGAKDLFGTPFYLLYYPDLLDVVKVIEGDFLRKDRKKTAFVYKIDKTRRAIIIGLTRLGEAKGLSGDGTLVSIRFKALKAGRVKLSFEKINFKDSRHLPVQIHPETGMIVAK